MTSLKLGTSFEPCQLRYLSFAASSHLVKTDTLHCQAQFNLKPAMSQSQLHHISAPLHILQIAFTYYQDVSHNALDV